MVSLGRDTEFGGEGFTSEYVNCGVPLASFDAGCQGLCVLVRLRERLFVVSVGDQVSMSISLEDLINVL